MHNSKSDNMLKHTNINYDKLFNRHLNADGSAYDVSLNDKSKTI